jgi:hypothetical protein
VIVPIASSLLVAALGLTAPAMPLTSMSMGTSGSRDVLVTATAGFVDTTAPPQPVPAQGDLPVARSALGEQARAVIALDVPADAAGTTVTFRASGQPGSSYGTSSVLACRVIATWSPGTGQPLSAAPAVDCSGAVPVTGPGPWTFDLSHVLRAWAAGAPVLGIALVDGVSAVPDEITFNVVGAEHVGTMTPAVVTAPPAMPVPAPTPAAPAGAVGGHTSQLGLGRVAPPLVPAPSAAAVPMPETAAVAPVDAPVVAAARVSQLPLPLDGRVWLLLPVTVAFLLLLRRAVSAAADDAGDVVTA